MGKQMGMLTGAPPKQPVSIFMTLHQRQDGDGAARTTVHVTRRLSLADPSLSRARTAARSPFIQSLEFIIKLKKKKCFSQTLLNSD